MPWLLAWLAATLVLAVILGRAELAQQREQFKAAAHAVMPLLEQRLVANEAALAGLAQAPNAEARARIVQRLAQTHPQILAVLHRDPVASWNDERLNAAEQRSLASRQAELAHVNLAKGRYALVLAAEPVSYALQIDFNAMVDWADWPLSRLESPIRITIAQEGAPSRPVWVVQAGAAPPGWRLFGDALPDSDNAPSSPGLAALHWQFDQSQVLKSASQKLVVSFTRNMGWADLPWSHIFNGSLGLALLLLTARALMRQRHDRLRAGELLRMGQLGRLNTLGELAAGMSRELKGPLASALAATQAAQQQLHQESLQPSAQVEALAQNVLAEEELRHASRIIERLNHVVERPDLSNRLAVVNLSAAVRHTLDVLQPELRRMGVQPRLNGPDLQVWADYSALQQIIHQLVMNALQAMQDSPSQQRQLTITLSADAPSSQSTLSTQPALPDTLGLAATHLASDKPGQPTRPGPHHAAQAPMTPQARLSIQDTGPGLDNRVLTHIFEPFFTTRQDGLGLGLSLCETFAHAMGGSLTAFNHSPHGAEFCLSLRLAG